MSASYYCLFHEQENGRLEKLSASQDLELKRKKDRI
jgi:hypothetical protein